MRSEVLLPGYIFVATDQPEAVRRCESVPCPSSLGSSATTMCSFLSTIKRSRLHQRVHASDLYRVVEFSSGVMEGDMNRDPQLPLMNQTGLIKKLDRHKRLAQHLEIEILGRETVKVGLRDCSKETLINQ